MLIKDASRLIQRYHGRNDPGKALNADQRRQWAADMVEVMGGLSYYLGTKLEALDRMESSDLTRNWAATFRAGARIPKPLPGEQ